MHIIHVNLAKGFRGGERQTVLLIRELAGQVTQQTFVCRQDSPMRDELKDIANIEYVDASHQLAGHQKASKASILHAHEAKAVHWAWLHKRLYGTPYVITRRVDTPIKRKWTNRHFYGHADQCVAISTEIKRQLIGWNSRETTIIPSAMSNFMPDVHVAEEFRACYADRFIVGHIGALVDKHKGQRLLLAAAEQLQEQRPDLLFVFFGQGEDGQLLQQESKHLNNVVWAGFKPNIGDFIPALDMFVFPSRNEGLGSILLDIMSAKVPIIATQVGGIPDLVKHNETGVLVPPNNAHALSAAISQLADSQIQQKVLVENAYQRLAVFSPQAMAEKYLTIYHTIVNASS